MDDIMMDDLMSTTESVSHNLDVAPDSWQEQLQAIRNITSSLGLSDTHPDEARRHWLLPFITVSQRVAFVDADNGAVQDVADWCLRQSLNLLQVYPEDVDILTLIGRNWLSRAQKFLANIFQLEQGSSSSEGSTGPRSPRQARGVAGSEGWLQTTDYVEARGILHPAVDYFRRAVVAAQVQDRMSGTLLAIAAEAHMSLGNVTSPRVNDVYFQQALSHLRTAAELPDYSLPPHLDQYLKEYGPLYPQS